MHDIDTLTASYADLYTKLKKLKTAVKDHNKQLKATETAILAYLEANNLKKLPVQVEGETMYLSIKNSMKLK